MSLDSDIGVHRTYESGYRVYHPSCSICNARWRDEVPPGGHCKECNTSFCPACEERGLRHTCAGCKEHLCRACRHTMGPDYESFCEACWPAAREAILEATLENTNNV